jgi:hypothetical protein
VSGRPAPKTDAIEITDAMMEAGAEAIFSFRDDLMAWSLAAAVY